MKTETKAVHTPGPWLINGSPSSSHIQIFSEDAKNGGCIAQVYRLGMSTHARFEELAANAAVIAAAPDMLEALELSKDVLEDIYRIWSEQMEGTGAEGMIREHLELLTALIAKPKGGAA